jgi:aminoglycoside phosphotransferase (APT) family kinase protein
MSNVITLSDTDYSFFLKKSLETKLNNKLSKLVPVKKMGKSSVVYYSKLGNQNIVIKITFDRNSYPAEMWVYEKLSSMNVPVPTVIFYCEDIEPLNIPCLVMSHVGGHSLLDIKIKKQNEKNIYGTAGKILSKINSIDLSNVPYGYGTFSENSGEKFESWEDFLFQIHDIFNTIRKLIDYGIVNTICINYLNKALNILTMHNFEKVLNHGDFGPDHLFILKENIVGVIDPGNSFVGPSEYDLGYFKVYTSPVCFQQALNQYTNNYEIEKINCYCAIISAHKAIKAHQIGDLKKRDFFLNVLTASVNFFR